MVTSTNLDESNTLYTIIEQRIIAKDDVCIPLYDQILAMEAIELHKLQKIIISAGGKPLELNTDAILYSGPKINIDDYYYDTNKTVSKYRYDKIDRLKVDNVCRMVRKVEAEFKTFQYNCIKPYQGKTLVNELGGDREFIDIINDVIKSDKGCLVTGIAGTGKTFLLIC